MEIAQLILLAVIAACVMVLAIWFVFFTVSALAEMRVANYLLGQVYAALLAYDESYDGWNDDSDDEDAPFGPQGDDEREAARWN